MTLHAALAAAATLLALAFAFSTLERYITRHRPHELMWTISLTMFALGSLGLWAGAAIGWSEWTFKAFYLFGAAVNAGYVSLAIVGAFGVNWLQSQLTTHYPDLWILVLGGMVVTVVLFIPDGVVGTAQKLMLRFGRSPTPERVETRAEEAKTVEAGRTP